MLVEGLHPYSQTCAVCKVVGDGRLATDLVAYLHRTAFQLEFQLFGTFFKHIVEDIGLGHLAQLGMAVGVVGEIDFGLGQLLVAERVEHAFGDHHGTVVHTRNLAFEDARDDHIDDFVEGYLGFVEKFGHYHHRIVAGRGDAESQMSGGASHGAHHEPVLAGAGVLHHRGADDGALSLG